MTVFIHEPAAPAAADVLPAELLQAAGQLEDGLRAVLSVNGVSDVDAAASLGDLAVQAVRMTAISWRRSGRLAPGTAARPVTGSVSSTRVVGTTVDQTGRTMPSNVGAVIGQLRRLHPDASNVCGLVVWSWTDPTGERVVEIAVPGADFIVDTGTEFRSVTPAAG
jgi:hypothetical protein